MIKINHKAPTIYEAIGIQNEHFSFFIGITLRNFPEIIKNINSFKKWLTEENLLLKIAILVNIALILIKIIQKKDDLITIEDMMTFNYLKCLFDMFSKPSEIIEFLYNYFPKNIDFLYGLAMICYSHLMEHSKQDDTTILDNEKIIFH